MTNDIAPKTKGGRGRAKTFLRTADDANNADSTDDQESRLLIRAIRAIRAICGFVFVLSFRNLRG
jgi:hypothetical protein